MITPDKILCSKTHEWVAEENNYITIGLSDWIVKELGDIVFVELPEIGTNFSKNEAFATIESVKIARELYMPIGGTIVEINENLINSPEMINENSFEAWLIKVKADDYQEDIQGLLDYSDYIDEVQ